MHAYDLGKLKGGLEARLATDDEPITLLDGKEIKLTADVLVIADADGAGGYRRRHGRPAHRVHRGHHRRVVRSRVLPALGHCRPRPPLWPRDRCRAALRTRRGSRPPGTRHRARHAVAARNRRWHGGAGARSCRTRRDCRAAPKCSCAATASRACSARMIADNDVKATLESLGMRVRADETGWLVTPPSHRFDIAIEADLIEELARIVGFESIPETDAPGSRRRGRWPKRRRSRRRRSRSSRRAATRKRSRTRSSIPRCRANYFPESSRRRSAIRSRATWR